MSKTAAQPRTAHPLSPQQVEWASQHDWFKSDNGDGTIEVYDRYSKLNKETGAVESFSEQITWVGGFKALRDWAGY